MKVRNLMAFAAGGLMLVACNPNQGGADADVALNNEIDSLSYALGVDIATNLEASDVTGINGAAMAKAISDQQGGDSTLFTPEEAGQIIRGYFEKKSQAASQVAREAGSQFLVENAQNPDVQVTASGLQYVILTEGTGPRPSETDQVRVHYHGTLIDGTVFDSSVERGQPAQFPVNGVIPGWVEALQMMPVGSKWKLFIPSNLAYGDRGAGEKIKPGATLIFEVELIDIIAE